METAETLRLNQVEQRIEATQCSFAGSVFNDVNLSAATFNDVSLSGATFDDVNLSGAQFSNVNLSNWQVRNANFTGLQIRDADLRNASISDCLTDGMTIGGIPVAALLAAYRAANMGGER